MKDKRLDVLLEILKQGKLCNYFVIDQGMEFCTKTMIGKFPKNVDCKGMIRLCELEDK